MRCKHVKAISDKQRAAGWSAPAARASRRTSNCRRSRDLSSTAPNASRRSRSTSNSAKSTLPIRCAGWNSAMQAVGAEGRHRLPEGQIRQKDRGDHAAAARQHAHPHPQGHLSGRRMKSSPSGWRPGAACRQRALPLDVGVAWTTSHVDQPGARRSGSLPVITRTMTITGAVAPADHRHRADRRLAREVLAILAGGATVDNPEFIDGGPMMGKLSRLARRAGTKTTGGSDRLPADHVLIKRRTQTSRKTLHRARTTCEQCLLAPNSAHAT